MDTRPSSRRILIATGAILLPVVLALVTQMIVRTTDTADAGILPSVTATPTSQPTPGGDRDQSTGPDDHGGSTSRPTGSDDHGGSNGSGGGSKTSTPKPTGSDDHGGSNGSGGGSKTSTPKPTGSDDQGGHGGGDD